MAAMNTGGNILVFNPANNPLTKYNFLLRVEGIYDIPCQRVQAFSREMEYEYIQEGGLNDYVHMIRKPASRPSTFSIECHAGIHYVDPLPVGIELFLPVMLFITRYPGYFNTTAPERVFTFTGCAVTKRTYGELSANDSGLVVDTIEFAYRELAVLDLPFDPAAKSVSYDGTQNPKNRSKESTHPSSPAYVKPVKEKNIPGGVSDEIPPYGAVSAKYSPATNRSAPTKRNLPPSIVGHNSESSYSAPSTVYAPDSNRSPPVKKKPER